MRFRIGVRSNSTSAPKTWQSSLPPGVVASFCSVRNLQLIPLGEDQDDFDQKRISGPLLDFIDIYLSVLRIPHKQLSDRRPG